MQFSETVVAAIIGAAATLSAALFQLFMALKQRGKFDARPSKRGIGVRAVISIIALMIASGVGGYLYAELRQQAASEDIHNMRDEINAKLQLLAATTERLAAHENATQSKSATTEVAHSVESVVFAPACQSGATCVEGNAQRFTLCGAVPSTMQVSKLELFAKPASGQTPWGEAVANFEQDLGGAKFTGSPSEHAQDDAHKAVCVDFIHWSTEPHLARLVLQYGAILDHPESTPTNPAVAATTTNVPATQSAALVSPSVAR
ncbi:MAG TPA: hypothetical protein VET48_08265 [Steroidobacteraceae bacterium]|nr:hypothetical protein [Steroidobacteraceae bacterium]